MTYLIVGGAASGKSAYAEGLLCKLAGEAEKVYIATMQPFDAEAETRIEKHRAQRAGRGFKTIECYVNLLAADVPASSAVLLEDIGNLCANELFDPDGSGEGAAEAIVRGVETLQKRCRALVIVSNEVLSGGTDYEGETVRYMRVLGETNRRLAALADSVCEVVSGIPICYKGGE